ncbi:hypothetical protein ACQZ61_04030 [Agrobacterium vitis]|uniref:hypothetical protein n=1 Tax=Agrobacterium vitis TaxID=373 RepID=UPI001F2FF2C0|nr:hypothetical protein [Agrobacterium vitis]MCF1452308.1 hypothetical protein [Agrobacterium vitis]
MATPAVVTCAANDWTLIASGATSAIAFQFRDRSQSGVVLPTSSSTKPATKSGSQGYFEVAGFEPVSNLQAASTDYFWFWPSGKSAVDLAVWVA